MHAKATFLVKQHITAEIGRGFYLAARFLDDESNAFCCRAKLLVVFHSDSFYFWLVNIVTEVAEWSSGKRIGCFNALTLPLGDRANQSKTDLSSDARVALDSQSFFRRLIHTRNHRP